MIDNLCSPALLYLGFSLTQITIDTFKGFYNTAFFKSIVMVIFTLLLNILCQRGLGVVSWMIVFIPFILMTYITAVLMFVFGLNPHNDGLNYDVTYPDDNTTANNLIVVKSPNNDNNDNEDYDPNDFTSGTPSDINNYN